MTALSANKPRKSRRVSNYSTFKVAASTTIYEGSLVMLDSAGYARPAAASVSNNGCVGVAQQQVDNSSGSAGDLSVKVAEGEFLMAGTTIAQASVGDPVYAEDDDTVDETQGSNEPRAGYLAELVSATSGWVRVSLETARA